MVQFRRPGVPAPLPLSVQHQQKAAQLRKDHAALDGREAALHEDINKLAYRIVELQQPEAKAELARLEAELTDINRQRRLLAHAAREHDRLAEEAEQADEVRRRKKLFAEIRSVSGTRNKAAQDVLKALDDLGAALGRSTEANAKLMTMIPGDVPKGDGNCYPQKFTALVAHQMLLTGRKYGVTFPQAKWYRGDFTDLAQVMRAGHDYVCEQMPESGITPSPLVETFEPVTPDPAAASPGSPEPPEVLSGAAWNALQQDEAVRAAHARNPDIDPFDGTPL